ncbi:hypothetical protein IAU59_002322 [Kwoniella sp. CBS 9459]
MGSTTSRQTPITTTSSSSSSSTATSPLPPIPSSSSNRRPSNTLARLNSLRRLSTLGRRDRTTTNDVGINSHSSSSSSMSSKRGRQGSSTSTSDSPVARGEKKKRFRGISPTAIAEISSSNRLSDQPNQSSSSSSSAIAPTPASASGLTTKDVGESPMVASRAPSPPTALESVHEEMETDRPAPITPYPQPSAPTISLSPPSPVDQTTTSLASSIPLPATPSPAVESSDPLESERLRSIAAIREALNSEGANYASSSSSPNPSVERLLNRFRRSSSYPDLSEQIPSSSSVTQPTMSDRLTALLGFSTPAEEDRERPSSSSSSSQTRLGTANDPSTLTPAPRDVAEEETSGENIEDLERRIEELREEIAETRRHAQRAQDRVVRAERAVSRRPQGAVLVIQGLAQTHTAPDEEDPPSQSHGSSGSGGRLGAGFLRPGIRARRSSEGSAGIRRRQREEEDRRSSSLETQARMIGGLLTVAAAATATTLLTPEQPPFPSTPERSPAASALESIVNRLRPSRPNRSQTVEAALSSYLRTALNSSTNTQAEQDGHTNNNNNSESIPAEAANAHISDGFQRFLEGLQGDLVTAVRDFAGPVSASPTREPEDDVGEAESFVTATEGVPTPLPSTPVLESEASYPQRVQSSAEPIPASDVAQAEPASSSVPSFHRQLGQNLPAGSIGRSAAPEVIGGDNGTPRRLNFFRAHLFPPVPSSTSETPSTIAEETAAAPDAMVPCIFIGVRSIRHDPSMTTEDLVQHPSFPFVDGQVPPNEPPTFSATPVASPGPASPAAVEDENDDPLNPTTPFAMPSIIPPARSASPASASAAGAAAQTVPERRSLRERFLDRLNPQRNTPRPAGPFNTYLVYVIGGNYPRNHPILSIPSLITGGPLTDEELALVSELMGQAKPPTVQKEDIERSGLKVVKGGDMAAENQHGRLLDVCAEKCLICLSEYEAEDDCRILNCRHGYHQECVDHWLSTGRNSCPACRSEAVNTSKIQPTTTQATTADEPAAESSAM